MKSAVVTLFEGDYHLGAAGLINSLARAGFDGLVVCGYRGPLPPWAAAAAQLASIQVTFVPVETPLHFSNIKPAFLQELWTNQASAAEQLFYIDPDIVVKAPWPVMARWALDGLALCEDMNASLPLRHPYRLAWNDFFQQHGIVPRRALDRYYNAGFIGIPRAAAEILRDWQRMMDHAGAVIGGLNRIKHGGPSTLFHSVDQDAMNMALLLNDLPINAAGPEAMDFFPGGQLLSHAAGGLKPWRGGFIREALRGRPPGAAQKNFYDFVSGPIPIFSPALLRRRRFSLRLAAALGRFYRRA